MGDWDSNDPTQGLGVHPVPGGAFPAAEGNPPAFQYIPLWRDLIWSSSSVRGVTVWNARWDTPKINPWPQIREKVLTGAFPRRMPGMLVMGQVVSDDLFAGGAQAPFWWCRLDIKIAHEDTSTLRSIYQGGVGPRIHTILQHTNGHFRFEVGPGPLVFQFGLHFMHGIGEEAPQFAAFKIDAKAYPLGVRT